MRPRLFRALLILPLLALTLGTLSGGVSAGSSAKPSATLDGQPIALSDVAKYACDDLAYPAIRCFSTEAAVIADVEALSAAAATGTSFDGVQSPLGITYCVWYWDQNYGSAVFYQGGNESNLGLYGWNDAITSFKQYANHQCRWYADNSYSGAYWTWPAGYYISNVGSGANDQFSSVWILQ